MCLGGFGVRGLQRQGASRGTVLFISVLKNALLRVVRTTFFGEQVYLLARASTASGRWKTFEWVLFLARLFLPAFTHCNKYSSASFCCCYFVVFLMLAGGVWDGLTLEVFVFVFIFLGGVCV